MVTRRKFVIGLGTYAAAAPLSGFGAMTKVHRVGFVAADRGLATGQRFEALRDGLRLVGHVEPKNLVIEAHWPDHRDHQYHELVSKLIHTKVDVIVAHGAGAVTRSSRSLHKQNSPIPLVMGTCPDPVAYGIVTSLQRPGGTVTGIADAADPAPRLLALLAEAVPRLSRVAILAHGQFPGHPSIVNSVGAAAKGSGIAIVSYAARSPAEFNTAFDEIAKTSVQAVLVAVDPNAAGAAAQAAALAIKYKMPTIFGFHEHAEAGGLMSYSEDINATYRQAATYVDKILRGARPATLPVTSADKFELVVNRGTAAALGIKMPAALLARADRVIA
jgi:putative ABC transport system substrate-binding protein